jgi:CDP-diacylglycerol--serine O-phosphatidyltransferase
MRPIRTVAVFPTLLTLGNLICGFFAVVVAARVEKPDPRAYPHLANRPAAVATAETENETNDQLLPLVDSNDAANVMLSGWLIFLAMVFDGLDGYVARLSRTTSDFGMQLDSICDVVSFGVAPGFLLVKMCPRFTLIHGHTVWIIAAAFAACAALRLARFNIETDDEDEHLYFSGLPSPAAAAVIASFAIMSYTLKQDPTPLKEFADQSIQMCLPIFGLVVALLMVSRIRYPHITNRILRGQRSFAHVVAVLFFCVAVMVVRGYALPIAAALFAMWGPAYLAWQLWVQRRRREEPLF